MDTLLISEDQSFTRFKLECGSCGHEFQETVSDESGFEKDLSERSCPECGNRDLSIVGKDDEIEKLCELADQTGAGVEFISTDTEEGKQFNNAFKGIGALLRYRL